ncbi:MAG: putative toxin-antitoxin system toxin component, PIN family [Prevotella sp.]|nr:putative toxin-antitoxin system toxin component, PIN family [Prevotella sp.]
MRIVLDTNCLIQSIPEHSPFFPVWLSVLRGDNTLCVTNEILEEYAEILQRLAGKYTAEYVLDAIIKSKHVELVTPFYHFGLITTDPDDNKFVDCAIAANARYIVSNDRHYDILRQTKFPAVNVIVLKDFLKLLHL